MIQKSIFRLICAVFVLFVVSSSFKGGITEDFLSNDDLEEHTPFETSEDDDFQEESIDISDLLNHIDVNTNQSNQSSHHFHYSFAIKSIDRKLYAPPPQDMFS